MKHLHYIVLIIIADQLASASDVANTIRQTDYKLFTGEFSMPGTFRVGSTSAGDMFLGALLPGLVLVGLYMLFVFVYARVNPKVAPPVPFEGQFNFKFWTKVIMVIIPPLALIFAVHKLSTFYLILKVANPIKASTMVIIQKRITIVDSGQPFFSK